MAITKKELEAIQKQHCAICFGVKRNHIMGHLETKEGATLTVNNLVCTTCGNIQVIFTEDDQ